MFFCKTVHSIEKELYDCKYVTWIYIVGLKLHIYRMSMSDINNLKLLYCNSLVKTEKFLTWDFECRMGIRKNGGAMWVDKDHFYAFRIVLYFFLQHP